MNYFKSMLLAGLGFAGGGLLGWWLVQGESGGPAAGNEQREPLYWVAPMDPDYKRDKPGKSPMGMDLVPVYEEPERSEPGVRISPGIEHNLGVELGQVEYGPVDMSVQTVGFVQLNEEALRHFHLRAQGWVSELAVTAVGDPVRAGQKLFEFYSPELVNVQQEYLSALAQGHETLANSSLLKLRSLGVSERDIDELVATRRLKQRLSYFADRDGYVAELSVRDGSYAQLDRPVLSIGQLDEVWVIAEVFERQASRVRLGQTVTVTTDAHRGKAWHGRVEHIYPVLNTDNRTLRARIIIPNPEQHLKPGMFAELRIHGEQEELLTVPRRAVIPTAGAARVVRQLEAGVYRSQAVVAGREFGNRVEILEGLAAGDRVVVSGQFLIDSESNRAAAMARLDAGQHQPGSEAAESPHHQMSGMATEPAVDHPGQSMQHRRP